MIKKDVKTDVFYERMKRFSQLESEVENVIDERISEKGKETILHFINELFTTEVLHNHERFIDTMQRLDELKAKIRKICKGCVLCELRFNSRQSQVEFVSACRDGSLSAILTEEYISQELVEICGGMPLHVHIEVDEEDFQRGADLDQPIPRLPQEYPLYQPHTHTTTSVLDGTNLTRSSGKQQELPIPPTTQTEDSGNLQAAGVQHIPQPSIDVQVEQVTSQLASLDSSWQPDGDTQKLQSGSMWSISSIGSATSLVSTVSQSSEAIKSADTRHAQDKQVRLVTSKRPSLLDKFKWPKKLQFKRKTRPGGIKSMETIQSSVSGQSTGTSGSSDTGYASAGSIWSEEDRESSNLGGDKDDPQASLNALHIQLNTPAVKRDQAQQFDLYCQIGDLYRTKLHNLQSALQYYQNMLECSQELSEDTKQAKAYSRLGLTCDILGLQQEAFRNHEKALAIYKVETKNETNICVAYKNLASSLTMSGQVSNAKINYESALAVAMETGNKTQQMDIYSKLGDLHREQLHEPQESHKYYTEMLALARDLRRKDKEDLAYYKLGRAHYDMGEYEESLEWDKKDLKMSQESGDKTGQITAHINIADSYTALGKLDLARSHHQSAMTIAMETGNKTEQMDIYGWLGDLHRKQLHEPQESHKYYTEMLALARDLGRKEEESLAYNRLGLAHYDMGEHEENLEWNNKYLKMRQETGDKTGQIIAHQCLAASYTALGKLDLARSHYQSAMTIAMETGNKTEQMDIYLQLGDLHREQLHEPQESHKYYTEMLALARDLGRKDSEGDAYNKLGLVHYDMGEHEESLEWKNKYLKMRQETGDKTGQIIAHQCLAASYKELGKLDLARSHYQSAMTIAMETGNKTQQMDIYLQLGDLHREQLHEPQESHKYYTEMLALARDLGRKGKESQAYNRLGLVHYDMGEYEECLELLQKDLKMRQESGDKAEQITAHKNIAASYKTLGKLDLARSHYQSAMTIAMETGNKTEQMDIYCELGDLHREQLHEPQESHKYYTEMLALARDLGRKDKESQAYNRLGLAHYDMGEHEESLEWHKKDLKMRQESGEKTEQIVTHQCLADSYKALGKLDLARSHYQSAMTIAMETGNKQEQEDIAKKLDNL
ncbi:uncharacterized protein LOC144906431 [Branchiostoma floridae x Branchiostoma belcheri]